MIRYIRSPDGYSILTLLGWGVKTYEHADVVPDPVQKVSPQLEGPIEIAYDPKTDTAKLVPFWEQYVTW